jgi:hypothetical protein
MKRLALLLLLLAVNLFLFAQQVVEVKYEADEKGNYKFSLENHGYCDYIVEVNFTDLQNLKTGFKLPYVGNAGPGSTTIFTLTRQNTNLPSNFRVYYRYIKGHTKPKIDMGYSYLLPAAPGKEIAAHEMDYFLKTFNNDPAPQDWYAVAIKMNAGDTVYASRRGVVTEVKDDANLKESGYALVSADNYVEVYHEDCSFARYQVLKDKNIFVKPGQTIEAGDPIGIVGGERYENGTHLRFCVYYTLDKDAFSNYEQTGRQGQLAYVPLQFWTKGAGKLKLVNGNKYVSEHPTALITQEMNKKDLKKWTEKETR